MKNYMNPPIPMGFTYVSGTWDKAFIIEDVKNKNRFTWIPLGICADFEKKTANLSCELAVNYYSTKTMLDKYQGIYVSTYLFSQNGKPITGMRFKFAKSKASRIVTSSIVPTFCTRLFYAGEYNAVIDCIAKLDNAVGAIETTKFEEYGLFGMDDLWIWTLTNHDGSSMVLKKGDSREETEEVYANNEWLESPQIGARAVLIVL